MNFKELANKKVIGVPVLYLAAAAVTILAIVAWRMKALPTEDKAGVDPADATAGAEATGVDNSLAGDPYSGLNTTGTVIVQPSATTPDDVAPAIGDNEAWVKAAAEWLVAKNKATGTDAYTALNKYVSGENLSYDEGALVNAAIAEKGQPPDNVGTIGTIGALPAQKQFTKFPGAHTVKSTNDNTPAKLATLYYGAANADQINTIVAANFNLGPNTTTYPVGTKINVPMWTNPRYYTVTGKNSDVYPSNIAAKNGITYAMVMGLNPGYVFPAKVGAKVRVL